MLATMGKSHSHNSSLPYTYMYTFVCHYILAIILYLLHLLLLCHYLFTLYSHCYQNCIKFKIGSLLCMSHGTYIPLLTLSKFLCSDAWSPIFLSI